jgi:hypothetical protein
MAGAVSVPARIGPCQFGHLGRWVTIRCPLEYDQLMRGAGDPGGGRWIIDPRRIGAVIRVLRRVTDPLFRRAGIDLDEG